MLSAACTANPDADAIIDGPLRLTHAQLSRRADALARGLNRVGAVAGDRVVILIGNRWTFAVAMLACLRAQIIAVPVGTRSSAAEVDYIAADCNAVALLHDNDLAGHLPDGITGVSCATLAQWCAMGGAPYDRSNAPEDDVAVILYTSGTTGRPKGALLSHLALVHSCMHFTDAFGLGRDDCSIMAVPASHVTGLVAVLFALLSAGGSVVMMEKFDAADFVALAASEAMTVTVLVPAMYNLCLMRTDLTAHNLSRWRIGAFGGAPMPVATMERLGRLLPQLTLVQVYGATETASPATIMPQGRQAGALASVGAPVLCADILIMNDSGQAVPPGNVGEVWIAGPMVSPGYWNDPERTRAAFPGGYWRSGDVGRIDPDGLLYIHDRIKDMINRGGYKVYSAEVENALSFHDNVEEVAVVGRACPVLGEKTHAVVRLVAGAVPDADNLRVHCRARLSDYKIPDTFEFVIDPLPRNANGKILKTALR